LLNSRFLVEQLGSVFWTNPADKVYDKALTIAVLLHDVLWSLLLATFTVTLCPTLGALMLPRVFNKDVDAPSTII